MQKALGVLFLIISVHHVTGLLTKMACRVSGNGTCVDPFCFVTPVKENLNAANFGCGSLTRPLNKIRVRQEFYFKFFQNYIPFNIFPEIEFCSFVRNPNQLSYFSSIISALNRLAPGFVKQCPYYKSDFQIKNLTIVNSDLALWITGEYKLIYTIYDDIDPKIYQVSARGVIKRN